MDKREYLIKPLTAIVLLFVIFDLRFIRNYSPYMDMIIVNSSLLKQFFIWQKKLDCRRNTVYDLPALVYDKGLENKYCDTMVFLFNLQLSNVVKNQVKVRRQAMVFTAVKGGWNTYVRQIIYQSSAVGTQGRRE
uniref:Uncharacterized protein n=1 Tax=Glossina brevipalpis TaxID=37001 RepID=A0A1A9WZI5_9MUSC